MGGERLRQEEERRRLGQIEKEREQTLRTIEMQRMREEEAQRIKREAILKKRKELCVLRPQGRLRFCIHSLFGSHEFAEFVSQAAGARDKLEKCQVELAVSNLGVSMSSQLKRERNDVYWH